MMENAETKPVTYDIKKEKRFQAKKRKLEALLNLFHTEEQKETSQKKIKSNGEVEKYKALKDELKQYMKKPELNPNFYLTEIGSKSQLKLKSNKLTKKVRPLFIQNIYQLLMKSVLGHMSPYEFKWAKLEQPQNISRTVLLVIEGLPKDIIIQNGSSLVNLLKIFNVIVETASSNLNFPQELTTLHEITHFHIENEDSYSTMFPTKKFIKLDVQDNLQKPSKVHLLLSPIQLVMENYPLPQSAFQFSKSQNYTFSKSSYAPVTADSPMFALDCEMCRTEKSNGELTRIAVVNEQLEIIYETLVKPKAKIIDYLTKFSGITKGMLQGVKTRLEDVQRKLREILPPDAILCGQSLNCDLHALKMIHPYCIDTSIIFNGSGIRAKKDSLKYLSMVHLNEKIQENKSGHNPIEDALATMKLVQLKLENSIDFGDECLKDNSKETETIKETNDKTETVKETREKTEVVKEANIKTEICKENNGIEDERGKATNITEVTKEVKIEKVEGFFSLTSKYSKKICLIGSQETLNNYGLEIPNNVQKIVKPNVKKVVKTTLNNMENFDLTISHIDFNTCELSDLVGELDRIVKLIFDNCSERTMFMVLISEINKMHFQDIRSGMFLANIKK